LWRAGASLVHGHAQMTLSHTMAHGRVELWHAAAARYHAETGGDYFADLRAVYSALGLATTLKTQNDADVFGFASLTPAKEREVTLLAAHQAPGKLDTIADPLWQTLRVAMRDLGVRTFNVAIFGPPYPLPDGAIDPAWANFPLVARFVDRGSPLAQTADIAALELFGSSVISSDPFEVARVMRSAEQ
ncbi:MAG TPA: hypothetical protein VKQ36_16570, partial [Ktedonobacterales bacterium]|nr:hypothetical protein [Ktedonobacterales bacterium]